MPNETTPEEKRRANFTFLLIMFPSLLLCIVSAFSKNIEPSFVIVFDVLILIFQYFVVKWFVESVYKGI
jgi:hypothetical protein